MKRIIFGLIGLSPPILVGMWLYGSFNSGNDSIMAPFGLLLGSPLLIVIFALPILIWAIVASIYGLKDKPIVHAYTIGTIVGIVLAFTIIPNLDVIKTYF